MTKSIKTTYAIWLLVGSLILYGGAFAPQLILGPNADRGASGFERILNALTYVPLHCMGIYLVARSLKTSSAILRQLWPQVAYIFLGILSIFWAIDLQGTMYSSYAWPMTFLTAVAVAATLSFDRFIVVASYTMLVCALASIFYIFFIPSWGLMTNSTHDEFTKLAGMPQGVFRHKNQLAEVMSFGLICVFCVGNRIRRPVRIALAISCLYCFLAAGSAGKLLGLVVAFLAYMGWRALNRITPNRLLAISLAAGALIGCVVFLPDIVSTLLPETGKDATLTGRTLIWAHALQLGAKQPYLGYGLGSLWATPLGAVPGMPGFTVPHSHNLWIEVFVRLGAVGVLLAATFVVKAIYDLLRARADNEDFFAFAFFILVSALVRSSLEVSLFENNDITSFLAIVGASYTYKYMAALSKTSQTVAPVSGLKSVLKRKAPAKGFRQPPPQLTTGNDSKEQGI